MDFGSYELVRSEFDPPSRIPWSHTQGPSADQWKAQRERFKRLYLDEDKQLKEVMALLKEQHGFSATVRMYKIKIKEWGLDKKNKESDVLAILRKKTQRNAVGKDSVFKLRGRAVDFRDVQRYAKRKHLTLHQLATSQSPSTPPELVCFTPPPLAESLATPQRFKVTECLFFHVRDYVLGAFDNQIWVPYGDKYPCKSAKALRIVHAQNDNYLHIFFQSCCGAAFALNVNSPDSIDEGLQMLNKACAVVQSLVECEYPGFLSMILTLFHKLCFSYKRPEVLQVILYHLSDMAEVILPKGHPLSQICTQFKALMPDQINETVVRLLQRLQDAFTTVLGPYHWQTLNATLVYLENLSSTEPDLAEEKLQSLLSICEQNFEREDVRSINIRTQLMFNLSMMGRYNEAEESCEELVELLQTPYKSDLTRDDNVHFLLNTFTVLANAQYKMDKMDSAISTLSRAVNVGATHPGWDDGSVLYHEIALEQWLTECGRHEEASTVREQRRSAIRPFELTT